MSKVSDPQHWRRRAEEARTLADELTDAEAKRKMLKIAEDYEMLATSAEQRLRLWEDNFKDKPYRLAAEADLSKLASDYELSGGSIINVLRYACLKAIVRNPPEIRAQDLFEGVRKELHKEGKFLKQPR